MATTIERAVWLMKAIADGNYGYSQPNRYTGCYGVEPSDFDCSSLVTYVWQSAGVPVRSNGASTTSQMYQPFIKSGFTDVTAQINLTTGEGLRAGDVCLYPYDGHRGHVEMMLDEKTICGARRDENGLDGWEGAQFGDQTGREIEYSPYANFPWRYVLRYTGEDGDMSYSAIIESSRDYKKWSTGAGVLTRACPYVSVKRSDIGFTPNVIVVQQENQCLAVTQWIRGQANIYCANYENDAYAGVAVGTANGFFNPDSMVELQIPVRFPSSRYIVRIYQ